MLNPRTKDLTSLVFGKLTVIKFIEYKEVKDRKFPMWECHCECGNKTEVRAASLMSGLSKSCGCSQREAAAKQGHLNSKTVGYSSLNYLFTNYKYRAARKKLPFELSIEDFERLTKENCYICGTEPMNIIKKHNYNGHYIYNGIDRLDNTKGYTNENVKPCCGICNKAKRDLTQEEFEKWIKRIVAFRQN